MSYSGDAAEQVVRMSLETGEVAVRLAGSGAKQLAILLYAILREQKKTAGKARLTNTIRRMWYTAAGCLSMCISLWTSLRMLPCLMNSTSCLPPCGDERYP